MRSHDKVNLSFTLKLYSVPPPNYLPCAYSCTEIVQNKFSCSKPVTLGAQGWVCQCSLQDTPDSGSRAAISRGHIFDDSRKVIICVSQSFSYAPFKNSLCSV